MVKKMVERFIIVNKFTGEPHASKTHKRRQTAKDFFKSGALSVGEMKTHRIIKVKPAGRRKLKKHANKRTWWWVTTAESGLATHYPATTTKGAATAAIAGIEFLYIVFKVIEA